jgi:quercetin dioxygenase-like cupin family protein
VTGVLRIDSTPRNSPEGPFGHIDMRWVVGPGEGATLSAFGQSTYVTGATHERHYHEHAEEIVFVVSGRGVQEVGDVPHDVGPGDICFIPRGVPHRLTGSSDDDLVILWMLGGAASVEASGYVAVDG